MKTKKMILNDFLIWLKDYNLLMIYFEIINNIPSSYIIIRNLDANNPDTLFDIIPKNLKQELALTELPEIDWDYIKELYTHWLLNI